ncbi:MAG TPA: Hpt domain-containing protein [Propionibacteriaceae bacterium]|nr:Hpt domain-containing protein [Propionibacteriaceae bacterium]
MGVVNNEAMAGAYAAIAQRAWTTNRTRAAELDQLVQGWRSTGALSSPERGRLRELAHTLHGSAGTFGHGEVAAAAAALEGLLTGDPHPELEAVSQVVARISHGLADPPSI